MKKLYYLIIAVLFLAASCERKNKAVVSNKKVEKVKQELDLLTDSLNGSWKTMIASDDDKIAAVKRLLEEISYTKKYDVLSLDSLKSLQEKLPSKRYTQENVIESQKIDAYDLATDSLLKRTFRLVNSTPDIENHPLAKTLAEDIIEADNKVVVFRARYDRWAKEYNTYIEKHEKQREKLGPPYNSYTKKGLFTISR
ncbi:MAG TPA: LemA family protein [Cytophagaceae bacterium]|jgi:hypothetical protein